MSEAIEIAKVLIEEGIAARGHFQVWWALRNKALPRFYEVMDNHEYVDFFHASNTAHYKVFLLALSKIFDRDTRVAGLKELRRALCDEGRADLANHIKQSLLPFHHRIKAVLGIRSRSLVHNERSLSREKVYKINGITSNQISDLIDATCCVINHVATELGINNTIFESDRGICATLRMLEVLELGNTQPRHSADRKKPAPLMPDVGQHKEEAFKMGIFSSMFNKMGHWHVKQLVKDCSKQIVKASMHEYKQKNNPYLTDAALDLLIEQGSFSLMKEKTYSNLKEKFKDYVSFYVVRNLGRDIDQLSGEMTSLFDEADKYWPMFCATKDGTQQKLKNE